MEALGAEADVAPAQVQGLADSKPSERKEGEQRTPTAGVAVAGFGVECSGGIK